ncbi:hypothetical protein LRX75_22545 [Rhizobium sp. DKSPLA3]|uniref:Transmembrane protein n=1 Tax=Rhizobium quercicola TaxID=2901226 RepID=A0A9X1NV43_9HYPH|nr:hypothetical protein [Rhizobium quercicola]MCD7111810.1 hypothetical protein [Rhizobium quercicola]
MSDGFEAPRQLSPKTPGRKIYGVLFTVAAFLVVGSTILDKAKDLPANVINVCRGFHVCEPPPLGNIPDLQTDYVDGKGAEAAAQPTLERYQAANPDYTISFHVDKAREKGSCDNAVIKIDCKYSYGGTFSAEPRWTGKLEWVALLSALIAVSSLIALAFRSRHRRT